MKTTDPLRVHRGRASLRGNWRVSRLITRLEADGFRTVADFRDCIRKTDKTLYYPGVGKATVEAAVAYFGRHDDA